MTAMRVKGVEYDMDSTFSAPELNALMFLKQHEGLSLRDVYDGFQTMAKRYTDAKVAKDAGEDAPSDVEIIFDLLSDTDQLNTFRGLVWLLKTGAGERDQVGRYLTVEDANAGISFGDIEFPDDEPEPEADVPHPTEGVETPQS